MRRERAKGIDEGCERGRRRRASGRRKSPRRKTKTKETEGGGSSVFIVRGKGLFAREGQPHQRRLAPPPSAASGDGV